ncbi:MAG: glutamate 5-kinase [Prevotella sp.]|nr:glutamate 5-kinase [Candidatus Prevotella equi]
MHRIVVKVGSNVLTTASGKLDITRLSSLVDQIAWLKEHRYQVILVSSGAVACGRSELKVEYALDSVEQRQLFSSIGQVKLVNLYYDLFREYGIHIGQVLTMKENFEPGDQYNNQRQCMEVMLDNDVIPVVNENDTVSVTELMFTDNDELAGLIARMMGAETLVLLSNIDGIYTGNPSDPASEVIREVQPGESLEKYIQTTKSSAGRGGMESKHNTARSVAESGIKVIIANGKRTNILVDLFSGNDTPIHTEFIPN